MGRRVLQDVPGFASCIACPFQRLPTCHALNVQAFGPESRIELSTCLVEAGWADAAKAPQSLKGSAAEREPRMGWVVKAQDRATILLDHCTLAWVAQASNSQPRDQVLLVSMVCHAHVRVAHSELQVVPDPGQQLQLQGSFFGIHGEYEGSAMVLRTALQGCSITCSSGSTLTGSHLLITEQPPAHRCRAAGLVSTGSSAGAASVESGSGGSSSSGGIRGVGGGSSSSSTDAININGVEAAQRASIVLTSCSILGFDVGAVVSRWGRGVWHMCRLLPKTMWQQIGGLDPPMIYLALTPGLRTRTIILQVVDEQHKQLRHTTTLLLQGCQVLSRKACLCAHGPVSARLVGCRLQVRVAGYFAMLTRLGREWAGPVLLPFQLSPASPIFTWACTAYLSHCACLRCPIAQVLNPKP